MFVPAGRVCCSYPFGGSLAGWQYTPAPPAQAGLAAFLPLAGSLDIYDPTTALIFSRAPLPPPRSRGHVQASVTSGSGERLGRDWYAKNDTLPMTLRVTEAEYVNLRAFFATSVRGMAIPFTWLDADGNATTVCFAEPRLGEVREKAYDSYLVPVTVRIP
jgi:hypothetical protein